MITGLLLVCLVVTPQWGLSMQQTMVIARSEARCHNWSNKNGGHGMVAYMWRYDLGRDDDRKEFEVKCGRDGIDCTKDKLQ